MVISYAKDIQTILDIYSRLIINEYGNPDLTAACITYLAARQHVPALFEIWLTPLNEHGRRQFIRHATYTIDEDWWLRNSARADL